MDLGLHGKVAVVTGASRGIGKAVAKGLIQEGCKVAICARNADFKFSIECFSFSSSPILAM